MKYTLIALILLSFSCNPAKVVTEREYRDTTIIRELTKIVKVPGQTIQAPSINIDSISRLINAGVKPQVINRTLTYTDPETNNRIGLILDELGNLSALCEIQDKQIELLEREIERIKSEKVVKTITKTDPPWKRALAFLIGLVFGILILWLLTFFRVV
jgi:uncharacterized small protein (DUF1192 family)